MGENNMTLREELKNIQKQQKDCSTDTVRSHDEIERDRQEVQKIFERRAAEQEEMRMRKALELYDKVAL